MDRETCKEFHTELEVDKMDQEFAEACKPILDFLYKHGNPHCTVIVTQAGAEMAEGQIGIPFELRD